MNTISDIIARCLVNNMSESEIIEHTQVTKDDIEKWKESIIKEHQTLKNFKDCSKIDDILAYF